MRAPRFLVIVAGGFGFVTKGPNVNLNDITVVIMDMDGVLWRGDAPLPGMAELFEHLRARGIPFALATNNSSREPPEYVAKLARLGAGEIAEAQIVTSGTTTAHYVATHYPPGTVVYVLGMPGLRRMLTKAGATVTEVPSGVDVVVVGIDFELTYENLKRASMLIRAGADFIGTNEDATFPMDEGLVPGAGSVIAAVRTATGRSPRIMGKPDAPMFEAALELLGTPAATALMIGDRMDTDIVGAQVAGLRTALVLTGVTTREELAQFAPPDGVYENLPALLADWR